MGTLSLPFGEGVQCVRAVLEPWWSKKTGGLEMEEIFLSDHWYSCKKQRELYHSLSSRETELHPAEFNSQCGASLPALGNSSCA